MVTVRCRFAVALAAVLGLAVASVAGVDTGPAAVPGGGFPARPRPPTITYWNVTVTAEIAPTDVPVSVRLFVPLSDERQSILARAVAPSAFTFEEESAGGNFGVRWRAAGVGPTPASLAYSFTARLVDRWFEVPPLPVADNPPPPDGDVRAGATATSTAVAPAIVARARALTRTASDLEATARALFASVAALPDRGAEDAAARAVPRRGRGDTHGRARMLVALFRAVGVPARLVGGLHLRDATRTRATIVWVEAWLGNAWVPFDPTAGHFAYLPADYLAFHHGDQPLLAHTAGAGLRFDLLMHQVTRETLLAAEGPPPSAPAGRARDVDRETTRVRTFAFYAENPVASVVLISDEVMPDAVIEHIVADARARAISVVFLSARFESRYFRENYLQRLIATNFGAIAESHLLLVTTRDEAGLYALLQLGEQRAVLRDARLVVAGDYPRPVGRVLGSVLLRLVDPGELVLVNPHAPLTALWQMARESLSDGRPLAEAAALWDIAPLVIRRADVDALPAWRGALVRAWSEAVLAQVPLQAINLILILPVIACVVVVFRNVVGIETFGTFAPVIVSLSFLITGLTWGVVIFAVIVGFGVLLRGALQWIRIQMVARLAILIALVSAMMAGLTVGGVYLGLGALLNVSIFPMVIMSHVIESFTTTQVEQGTRAALRLTGNTLLVCAACYATIEYGGLQSWILAFPELLTGVIVLEVAIGRWRGLRLLEYPRFYGLVGGGTTPE